MKLCFLLYLAAVSNKPRLLTLFHQNKTAKQKEGRFFSYERNYERCPKVYRVDRRTDSRRGTSNETPQHMFYLLWRNKKIIKTYWTKKRLFEELCMLPMHVDISKFILCWFYLKYVLRPFYGICKIHTKSTSIQQKLDKIVLSSNLIWIR